jgi:hypothetical protein
MGVYSDLERELQIALEDRSYFKAERNGLLARIDVLHARVAKLERALEKIRSITEDAIPEWASAGVIGGIAEEALSD